MTSTPCTQLSTEYDKLFQLIDQNITTLPQSIQDQFSLWKTQSKPIIDTIIQNELNHTHSPTSNQSINSGFDKTTNLTTLLVQKRLKPHELQKLRQQATAHYESIVIKILTTFMIECFQSLSSLPLPPHSTPMNDTNTIPIDTIVWNGLELKKTKSLSTTSIFSTPALIRTAHAYLRTTPLYHPSTTTTNQTDGNENASMNDNEIQLKPILSPELSGLWAQYVITTLQTAIQQKADEVIYQPKEINNESTTTSSSTPSIDDISTTFWKFIKIELPTNSERSGGIDFFYDFKSHRALLEHNNTNDELNDNSNEQSNFIGDDKNDTNNAKKRKQQPVSTSPSLLPLTSKHNPNSSSTTTTTTTTTDSNSTPTSPTELVSLSNDNDSNDDNNQPNQNQNQQIETIKDVDQEIDGLFDFAPTTGESRHCINPDTTDLQQFQFTALGYINSCYRAKFSTPRQGNAAPSSHASLTVHTDVRFHALLGLEKYSHIWLVFVFHSNAQSSYRPKITPPRLGERVGCLATRSPHRFNDIGLSLVKLDTIQYPEDYQHLPITHPSRQFIVHTPGINSKAKNLPGCARLILSNVDLIDGTPILDIKPFNPGDLIPNPSHLRFPDWLSNAPLYTLNINIHQQAIIDLYNIFYNYYNNEFTTLSTKATKFHTDIDNNGNNKLKSMDKHTFTLYSKFYQKDRIDKIQQYLQLFQQFRPNNDNGEIIYDTNTIKATTTTTSSTIATTMSDSTLSTPSTALIESSSSSSLQQLQQQEPKSLTCDQIQEFLSYELGSPLQFYPTISGIKQAIIDTLRNDPRPIWTKHENRNHAIFGFLYDNLNIVYQMNGDTHATVCFLQLRSEYLQLCQLKDKMKNQDKNYNNNNVVVVNDQQKRGWVDLIKHKIAQTTTDPTDSWAKQIHLEQQQKQ